MKQKPKIYISIAIFTLLINNISKANNDSTKIYFQQSFTELKNMLEGKLPINFERAVFITENPYWDNKYSYSQFQNCITENIWYINLYKKINDKSLEIDFRTLIDFNAKKIDVNTFNYTEWEKRRMYENAVTNWSIFNYMTDTTYYLNIPHYPFSYQINDPFGMNDWKNSQVINLLNYSKSKGNCLALTSLFKIFADRLSSEAYICTAPQHIYIQHKDVKGDFYNVELATATHPGDGSIKTLTYTDYDAIANGIALRRLTDDKENISLCLVNLAKAYEHKLNVKDDDFILQCAELALHYDSLNLNAMLLKAQILEEKTLRYASKKHITDVNKLKLDKEINSTFKKLETQIVHLNELGYHQMPLYMQQMILSGLQRKENEKILVRDKTPNPFPSLKNVAPEDKRYSTLSKGVFEEVHEKKQFEQYGRFIIDTQKKKICILSDSTNFRALIDPVVFAWQVDPLAHKQPYISPYNAFNANPIYYVDPDGRIVIPADDKSKAAIETQIKTVFAGEIAQFAQNLGFGTVGTYNDGKNDIPVSGFKFIPSQGVRNTTELLYKIKQSNLSKEAKALASAYVNAIGDMNAVVVSSVEQGAQPIVIGSPVINNDGSKASQDYANNPTATNLENLTGANSNGDGVLYYPSKDGKGGKPLQITDGTGSTLKGNIEGAYTTNKATPSIINEIIGDFNAKSNNTPVIKTNEGKTYLNNNGDVVTDPPVKK